MKSPSLRTSLFAVFLLLALASFAVAGPVAFGTNDDLALMALADGTFTGQHESQLIFTSPLIGGLLVVLYSLVPDFNWYVYLQLVLVFSSFSALFAATRSLRRSLLDGLVVIAIALYALPKFILPLQFTSTSVLATFAGIVVTFSRHSQTRFLQAVAGGCLILGGVSLRPEAGLLSLALFVPPLFMLRTWPPTGVSRWSLLQERRQVSVLVAMAATLLIPASLGVLSQNFNVHPSPTHRNWNFLQQDLSGGKTAELEAIWSGTELQLLTESGGWYFDSPEALARLDQLSSVASSRSLRDSITVAVSEFFGRDYFGHQFALVAILLLQIFRSRNFVKLAVGFVLPLTSTVLALSLLVNQFERLPYRLLMPLWTCVISLGVLFSASTKISLASRPSIFAKNKRRFAISVRSVFDSRFAITLIILTLTSPVAVAGFRYPVYFMNRYRAQVEEVNEKLQMVECVTTSLPAFFEISSSRPLPGGDIIPLGAKRLFAYPIVDNGWILHSSHFRKRLELLGVDSQGTLSETLSNSKIKVVASEGFVKSLSDHLQLADAGGDISVVASNDCGVLSWQISVLDTK